MIVAGCRSCDLAAGHHAASVTGAGPAAVMLQLGRYLSPSGSGRNIVVTDRVRCRGGPAPPLIPPA